MPVHHFTLIVEGADLQAEPTIEALFESGCNDATVERSDGVQYIAFDREAESLAEAVHSAQRDVEKVGGVRVARTATLDRWPLEDIATIDPQEPDPPQGAVAEPSLGADPSGGERAASVHRDTPARRESQPR